MKKLIPIFITILFVILNINSYSQVSLQNIVSEEISNEQKIDEEIKSERQNTEQRRQKFLIKQDEAKIKESRILDPEERKKAKENNNYMGITFTPITELSNESNTVYTLTFPFDIEDKALEEEIMKILKRKFISVAKSDKFLIIESPVVISQENFEMNISHIVSTIQSSAKN